MLPVRPPQSASDGGDLAIGFGTEYVCRMPQLEVEYDYTHAVKNPARSPLSVSSKSPVIAGHVHR